MGYKKIYIIPERRSRFNIVSCQLWLVGRHIYFLFKNLVQYCFGGEAALG
jgi:hypothetical protein